MALTTSKWTKFPDCQNVNEFCLHVKLTPCHSLFVASLNLAASQPRQGFFECFHIAPEGLGNESPLKMSVLGSGFSHENFINIYPLKMPNFSPVWHAPPPPPVVFLLSTLAPKWAALTLNLSTQHCAQVSHLHAPHKNSTSTCFSTAQEVPTCLTQLLTARTGCHPRTFQRKCS